MKYILYTQVAFCLFLIVRHSIPLVRFAWRTRGMHDDRMLLCMSPTEQQFILWCQQNLTGNILWTANDQPDHILSYFILPRKVYWRLDPEDKEALKRRGITLIVTNWEHGKVGVKQI